MADRSDQPVGGTLPDGTVRVVTPPIVYLPCALDERGEVAEIKMARLRDGGSR